MTHPRYWTPAEEAIVRQHYPHRCTAWPVTTKNPQPREGAAS